MPRGNCNPQLALPGAIKAKKVIHHLQWLSELIECGNLQIGKPAVALWIPMTQK